MSTIHHAPDQGLQARQESLTRDGLNADARDSRGGERHGESRNRFETALRKAQGVKIEPSPLAVAESKLFDLFRPQGVEKAGWKPPLSSPVEHIVRLTADLAADAGSGSQPVIRQMSVTLAGTGLVGLSIRLDDQGLDLTLLTDESGLLPALAAAGSMLAEQIQSRLGCRRVRIFEERRRSP